MFKATDETYMNDSFSQWKRLTTLLGSPALYQHTDHFIR